MLTGAASPRGIGRATAEMLASGGWAVAILDIDGDAARKAAAEITDVYGVQAVGVGADVSDPAAVNAAIDEVECNAAADRWPGQPGRHQLTHGVHGRDPRGLGAGVQDQHDRHVPGHAAGAQGHDRAEAGQDCERLVHLRPARRRHVLQGGIQCFEGCHHRLHQGAGPGNGPARNHGQLLWLQVPWTPTSWVEH